MLATTENTKTQSIVGIARMNDTIILIIFDVLSFERFFAAKKDKNNAIKDPINFVNIASAIVIKRLLNTSRNVYLSDNRASKNIIFKSFKNSKKAEDSLTPPILIVASVKMVIKDRILNVDHK